MKGTVVAVCVSERKGVPKHAVERAALRAGHGIEGDAHAGPWHRQVSLLADADVATMRAQGLDLAPGAFGENLVLGGIDLGALGLGSRLRVGGAELELTQIGKLCHTRCAIFFRAGDCVMPRAGVFAQVVGEGAVEAGDAVEVTVEVTRTVTQAAVVTVSDRCAAGTMRDTAGPALAALVNEELGAHVAWTGVAPDDAKAIADTLTDLVGRGVDLILTAGGTGLARRDVTPEATRAVIDREVPGLAEAMRAASLAVTPHAALQRGVCGVCRTTLIVNLPGSEKGAIENLRVILPALPHAVRLLRGDEAHPELDAERRVEHLDLAKIPEVCE
jgi:molybdopterin adenylyltransferase